MWKFVAHTLCKTHTHIHTPSLPVSEDVSSVKSVSVEYASSSLSTAADSRGMITVCYRCPE